MKKFIIVFLISFIMVTRAFSYSMITDSNLFYTFFEKPMTIIDFTDLKDGTSYEKIRFSMKSDEVIGSDPQCSVLDKGKMRYNGEDTVISVRSNAFSDNWSFSATDIDGAEVSCEAVIWFNQGISAGDSKITVTSSAGKSEPFVLYTNKGFVGVVPDNSRETVFIFDNFSVVFGFETAFERPTPNLNFEEIFMAQLDIDGMKRGF